MPPLGSLASMFEVHLLTSTNFVILQRHKDRLSLQASRRALTQYDEWKFLFTSSLPYSVLLMNDFRQHVPILWTVKNNSPAVQKRVVGLVGACVALKFLSSCNNVAHQWFVSEAEMRGKRTQESDSPSIFEALCYSSPLWLLHLIHSFHAALYDSLPALPPNTLIPCLIWSINPSIFP